MSACNTRSCSNNGGGLFASRISGISISNTASGDGGVCVHMPISLDYNTGSSPPSVHDIEHLYGLDRFSFATDIAAATASTPQPVTRQQTTLHLSWHSVQMYKADPDTLRYLLQSVNTREDVMVRIMEIVEATAAHEEQQPEDIIETLEQVVASRHSSPSGASSKADATSSATPPPGVEDRGTGHERGGRGRGRGWLWLWSKACCCLSKILVFCYSRDRGT